MSLDAKYDQVLGRHREIQDRLASDPSMDAQELARLSKELSDLDPVVAAIHKLQATERELADLSDLAAAGDDPEMQAMAAAERDGLAAALPELEHELKLLLLPRDAMDEANVILEVRAGTGGDEAALFAGDLVRMYQRYADVQNWRVEIMSATENDLGGIKELIANISGQGVFSHLKYESGVHRVQRVPVTEAGGRIHTSAATVAVLPEPEDVEVEIEDKDLRVDVYRSSGAGGQHVNTTDSAVRITHLPTGVVVTQQDEKSQHKNRAKAMKVLRARLFEMERQKQMAERAASRKDQVGSGDRSERIRTYNFPQNRVTDHRIGLTLYKLDRVITGDGLNELIHALWEHEQAAKLAALDETG